mmetsp:Transcript_4679/g.5072  ORF Transcript_4679/g.5072 Transcript_4679/m.5072 type:complete len:355 (+) Transcript_4679:52-1116(+)
MAEPHLSFESGFFEAQGRRDTMEDTHVVFDWLEDGNNNLPKDKQCKTLGFFGVYDGHGGVDAAQLVQSLLHKCIIDSDKWKAGDVDGAIVEGFKKTDETIVSLSNEKGWMNGSTAVCGIVVDKTLYIANIGDSEGVLIKEKDGEIVPVNLTTPHKASLAKEKKRIEDLGGHVFFGRVFGALAVSRSFGDAKFKKPKTTQNFVSWEPATQTHTLTPDEDRVLLLACDGLWDVMNHEEAAAFIMQLKAEGKTARKVAKLLVEQALAKKTEDNVTVVVTYLKWGAAAEAPKDTKEKCEDTEEEETPKAEEAKEETKEAKEETKEEVKEEETPKAEETKEETKDDAAEKDSTTEEGGE